jgi:hypothetical protein
MAFLGTDLDSAYPISPRGGAAPSLEDMFNIPNNTNGPSHKLEPVQLLPQQRPNVGGAATDAVATPPQRSASSSYYDPNAIHQQVKYEQEVEHLKRELQRSYEMRGGAPQSSGPSLFESLWAKRRDMLKSVIFALLVLLGIALHTAFDHVLKKYIMENDLTGRQETLARFAYPAGVALLVWLLKVLNR